MYPVETMSRCIKYLARLREEGYTVWSMQYCYDHPEGFHACFGRTAADEEIELVTHKEDIQDEIVAFNSKNKKAPTK